MGSIPVEGTFNDDNRQQRYNKLSIKQTYHFADVDRMIIVEAEKMLKIFGLNAG